MNRPLTTADHLPKIGDKIKFGVDMEEERIRTVTRVEEGLIFLKGHHQVFRGSVYHHYHSREDEGEITTDMAWPKPN